MPIRGAHVHEDAGQLERRGGVAGRARQLRLQLGNALAGRRALGQGRFHLHVGPGIRMATASRTRIRQVENARYHGTYSYLKPAAGSSPATELGSTERPVPVRPNSPRTGEKSHGREESRPGQGTKIRLDKFSTLWHLKCTLAVRTIRVW